MLSINGDTMCHGGPPGSLEVPEQHLVTVRRALTIIATRIRGKYKCDEIFTALPGGRSFQDLFDDPNCWVNYDPSNAQNDWGWTMPSAYPSDVVITQFTLRMGRWSTAGTIVHELAHLNGAPGGASHAAEETLKYCGLQSPLGPYNPHIKG
jgi:hypothetical protein